MVNDVDTVQIQSENINHFGTVLLSECSQSTLIRVHAQNGMDLYALNSFLCGIYTVILSVHSIHCLFTDALRLFAVINNF